MIRRYRPKETSTSSFDFVSASGDKAGGGGISRTCPLFPQQQTFVEASGTSALCHNPTYAPQQYILDDPYRHMGVAVGIFATPEKFSALPISVLEL
jgi:hypothetical protein